MKGNTMNAPKSPDHKLIGAARALASDTLNTGGYVDLNVLPAVLYELADRLAELTQPQPIETAPRGQWIRAFGGTLAKPHHAEEAKVKPAPDTGIDARIGFGNWYTNTDDYFVTPPSHWLPCVGVDVDALEGKGDE